MNKFSKIYILMMALLALLFVVFLIVREIPAAIVIGFLLYMFVGFSSHAL